MYIISLFSFYVGDKCMDYKKLLQLFKKLFITISRNSNELNETKMIFYLRSRDIF